MIRVLGASRKICFRGSIDEFSATKGIQLFIVDVDPRFIDPRGVLCLFNFPMMIQVAPLEVVLYHSNR